MDASNCVVGELTVVGRSQIVRTGGRSSSENAGISSESKVRIFTVENLRFPGEGSSAQGKSGPKARPRGVADGQAVNIPPPDAEVEPRRTPTRDGSGR